MKSDAQYKQAQRERKRDDGLKLIVQDWVPKQFKPEADAKIKKICATYRERHDSRYD